MFMAPDHSHPRASGPFVGAALIFGLVFATVLTLGFVPVLYSLMFGCVSHPARGA